jgi:hypothetical protein
MLFVAPTSSRASALAALSDDQSQENAMSTAPTMTPETLSNLQRLLDANPSVDWRAFSFEDSGLVAGLSWHDLAPHRDDLIPVLKAYQRLLYILPTSEDRRAPPLLGVGLHSAIQIASMPQDQFAQTWAALFPSETALGEAVHRSAVIRRSNLLLHHVSAVQSSEPHYRATRFR